MKQPIVLSVAGFDPSGGAGILADIKTFESHRVQGLGVCSALTFQNDKTCEAVRWVAPAEIERQISVLAERFRPAAAKIGLIESLAVLDRVLSVLADTFPGVRIVWDPILRASAGFVFHESIDPQEVERICRGLALVTPNTEEILQLRPAETAEEAAARLSRSCPVLLTGGHVAAEKARDILYTDGGAGDDSGPTRHGFESPRLPGPGKHGTGCVLSAAICAWLAGGSDLPEACARAKNYVGQFIAGGSGRLGCHAPVD